MIWVVLKVRSMLLLEDLVRGMAREGLTVARKVRVVAREKAEARAVAGNRHRMRALGPNARNVLIVMTALRLSQPTLTKQGRRHTTVDRLSGRHQAVC